MTVIARRLAIKLLFQGYAMQYKCDNKTHIHPQLRSSLRQTLLIQTEQVLCTVTVYTDLEHTPNWQTKYSQGNTKTLQKRSITVNLALGYISRCLWY